MRPISLVLLALFAVACGPSAPVVNSPTPAPTELPSTGPTNPPGTVATATPGPAGSGTPIPPSAPSSEPTGGSFGPFAKLDPFPASGAFEVTDVSVTPSGYVAVGFGGLNGADYYGLRQGIVWTSVDGISWSELVDPSLVNVSPLRVVSRGSDLFMVGTLSACSELDDNCTDVAQAGNGVWRSTNGGPWELLPQLPDMQHGVVDNMFLAADRLVVFGGAGDSDQTTVWMSQDGASWTATTDLAGMDPVTAMAVGPAGFTAFGTYYDETLFDVTLLAATSSDGVHFSPANVPSMNGSGIDDLAAGPAGMVGVGFHSSEALDIAGVAVQSTDGLTWTQAANADGTFADSAVQTVHALPAGGYVALGYTPRTDDYILEDGAAWFSADGGDWKLIARLDGAFSQLSASAMGSGGVVVFASEETDIDEDTVGSIIHAWFAPLSSLHG